MNAVEQQDYTKVSRHWDNPYESSAVYVPLAEVAKASVHIGRHVRGFNGIEYVVTDEHLIAEWTANGQRIVDAYIVPQLDGYTAGIRFSNEGRDVLTPGFHSPRLERIWNKYCANVPSRCGKAKARLKWHANLGAGLQHELRFDVEHGHDTVQFDAAALVTLLFQTNPSYAEKLVKQARAASTPV